VPPRFVDTNIFLRYLTRDDEQKAEQALALLRRVERGEEKIATSVMVIFETVFTLQHSYGVAREQTRQLLSDILSLRGLRVPGKSVLLRALDLYSNTNISFADAYNAAFMEASAVSEIYSWDTDFDKLPGITRLEPS